MLTFERQHWACGRTRVAGVDEAGRGPLAGPVVAAAVVFDPAFALRESEASLADLTDSKQLTAAQRDSYFALLTGAGPELVAIGVGRADVAEIDRHNILRATHMAMYRAVEALPARPEHILVDGLAVHGLPAPTTPIVRGDGKSLSIAAASVIAKVTRDRIMIALDAVYPAYGFAVHKGYGTAFHIQRLLAHGPCPEHRRSFRPVADAAGIRRRADGAGAGDREALL